jgi:outer membrane protein OmpA-like peptidoglycan-associated protein
MGAHRSSIAFIAGILCVSAALGPAECLAQENSGTQLPQPNADREGCADLKAFPKLPMSMIVSCDKGDSVEVILPLKPDAQGYAREKSVRGFYESREYQIPERYHPEQAFGNIMNYLPMAGFTIKYSASPSTITARKGDTWVLFNFGGEYYDVKAVRAQEDPWAPVKDAQEISREMEAHNRVAIYGIEFSPDDQTVLEEHSKILGEILKYLKGNAGLTIDVESHTMRNNGNAQDDQEITRKRAQAVIAWLEAHSIAAGRLRPKAFGRNKPITENDTPLEIQRNDRIELVRITP